jgi:hypothetical protein
MGIIGSKFRDNAVFALMNPGFPMFPVDFAENQPYELG